MRAFHDVSRPSLPSSPVQSPTLVAKQNAALVFFFQAQIGVPTQGHCVELRPPRALKRVVDHQLKKQSE